MDHRPYKDWLLGDDPLTPEQSTALDAHLSECAACRQLEDGWGNVQLLFEDIPAVNPPAGLINRWQQRLANETSRRQKQQAWLAVGLAGGVALSLLVILGFLLVDVLQAPSQLGLIVVTRLLTLVFYLDTAWEITSLFSEVSPSISIAGFALFSGLVSILIVLWLVVFRQFSTVRRIIQ